MTNHPAMFDISPDRPIGVAGRSSSKNQPGLKATLLQAVITGLFGGVALIGLIENVARFGDPEAIHAEVRQTAPPASAPLDLRPTGLQDALSVQGPRADRLDYVMVQAAPTDLAAR